MTRETSRKKSLGTPAFMGEGDCGNNVGEVKRHPEERGKRKQNFQEEMTSRVEWG